MRQRLAFGVLVATVVLAGVLGTAGPAGASTPTLSKTTGLRFHEPVTLHAESDPESEFYAFQCFGSGGVGTAPCVQLAAFPVPAGGVVDVPVVLMRRHEFPNGPNGPTTLDCTTVGTACHVDVSTVPTSAVIPLTFDPTAPIPVVSVTPSTNLPWSTPATVHGTGFVPGLELAVTQCARLIDLTFGSLPFTRCSGVKHEPHAFADATGAFTFPIVARRLLPGPLRTSDPSHSIDCARADVECFERVLLPSSAFESLNRETDYGKGPVDTALDVADDGIPVALVRKSYGLSEHHLVVKIRVTLASPATSPLFVSYSTGTVAASGGYGSATPGSDYVAKTSRLRFLPGDTHHSIQITIVDDAVPEPVDRFAVNLSGSFHANTRSVIVAIGNDAGER
jgi:hypothetical protein